MNKKIRKMTKTLKNWSIKLKIWKIKMKYFNKKLIYKLIVKKVRKINKILTKSNSNNNLI